MLFCGMLFFGTYALADGIRIGSMAGTVMAAISLMALGIVYLLFKKLNQLHNQEEEDLLN